MYAPHITSLQHLDPQSFSWYTFDPCIKPALKYHKMILNSLYTPLSIQRPYFNLLGRIVIIGSAPLGYLAVGIPALVGWLFDSIFKADLGYDNRHCILLDAASSDRRDIVNRILNLNRHTNQDLFNVLRNAGIFGHLEIVEDVLDRFDSDANLDLDSQVEMKRTIGMIKMNGQNAISDLVNQKYANWKNNSNNSISPPVTHLKRTVSKVKG